MIVLYTSQEIKSFRTQAEVTGKLLHSWFGLHLWQKDLRAVPYLAVQHLAQVRGWDRTCATSTCALAHSPPFWCYVSFCWRFLKEQSCLSNKDRKSSTSVHVGVRDSCLMWFSPVALVSVPGKSKGEKCKTWKTKKGKPRECSNTYYWGPRWLSRRLHFSVCSLSKCWAVLYSAFQQAENPTCCTPALRNTTESLIYMHSTWGALKHMLCFSPKYWMQRRSEIQNSWKTHQCQWDTETFRSAIANSCP